MSAETKSFLSYGGLIIFVIGVVFSSGILWATVISHDQKLASVSQMQQDIAVIKAWVEDQKRYGGRR